jgi:Arc/MetJ family transcription regulator
LNPGDILGKNHSRRGIVTKRLIDVDDDLIEIAKAYLGTSTLKDTVNQALLEIKARRDREEELAWWSSDPLPDLRNPEVMEAAWRRDR